jgi:hypothetical protein
MSGELRLQAPDLRDHEAGDVRVAVAERCCRLKSDDFAKGNRQGENAFVCTRSARMQPLNAIVLLQSWLAVSVKRLQRATATVECSARERRVTAPLQYVRVE